MPRDRSKCIMCDKPAVPHQSLCRACYDENLAKLLRVFKGEKRMVMDFINDRRL